MLQVTLHQVQCHHAPIPNPSLTLVLVSSTNVHHRGVCPHQAAQGGRKRSKLSWHTKIFGKMGFGMPARTCARTGAATEACAPSKQHRAGESAQNHFHTCKARCRDGMPARTCARTGAASRSGQVHRPSPRPSLSSHPTPPGGGRAGPAKHRLTPRPASRPGSGRRDTLTRLSRAPFPRTGSGSGAGRRAGERPKGR